MVPCCYEQVFLDKIGLDPGCPTEICQQTWGRGVVAVFHRFMLSSLLMFQPH